MKKDDTINDLFDFCFVHNPEEISAINAEYKALQGVLQLKAKPIGKDLFKGKSKMTQNKKIPELTAEQFGFLLKRGVDYRRSEDFSIKDFYLSCLQIADQQGLLTKEASLALKPDNWIEWHKMEDTKYEEWRGIAKDDNKVCMKIDRNGQDNYFANTAIIGNAWQYSDALNSLDEAQEYCQNWLNNYLKENQK